MIDTIVKDTNNFSSTSFFGDTVITTCRELTELFGDWSDSDPDKVNFEWNLFIKEKEIPFTIYDWKEPWLDEHMVTEYHIGARNPKESKIAKDLVNEYLKNFNY